MTSIFQNLPIEFYTHPDVVRISRELLGKVLVTDFDGGLTAGMIVETEAYRAPDDKACHAHLNRFTERTKVMFMRGGHAYIYLCYGIHHLFNVVTGPEGAAHAVLVRAIEPLDNLPLMLERRTFTEVKPQLTTGPGVMSRALGINKSYTGLDLTATESPIQIEDRGIVIADENICAGPRIGVDYAEECAEWPWRFWIKGSRWVSGGGRRGA